MIEGAEPLPPLYQSLGISVLSASRGLVMLRLSPATSHANPYGLVGGGVVATVLDTATAWACDTACNPGSNCVTVDMKLSFHRPVKTKDDPLTATAKLIHSGSRIKVAHGELVDGQGKLIATAIGPCLVIGDPPWDEKRGDRHH